MKLLFIGGTGNISAASTVLAHRAGHEVWLLNRGSTHDEVVPEGTRTLVADARDEKAMRDTLGTARFDAVVQWIGYHPAHVAADIRFFADKTAQYVYISSTAAYQKPPPHHVVTERTPLSNPYWQYARDKIACEDLLVEAHRRTGFPVTIVRPSHTYGRTKLPIWIGSWGTAYTVVDRMRRGERIVVPGDGTALWTVTHSTDFAKGLIGLLGNLRAVGEAFHLTSDEVLTWNQIYREIGNAAGADPVLVHLASDFIAAVSPKDEGTLLGDKMHSTVFDNYKLKSFVPDFEATTFLEAGARETIAWFDSDPRNRKVDHDAGARWDRILDDYARVIAR